MEQELIDFITREFMEEPQEGSSLGSEDDILTTGIIDSLGVMKLVSFIEKEFSINIPPGDVTIENFLNVSVITNYIEKQKTLSS